MGCTLAIATGYGKRCGTAGLVFPMKAFLTAEYSVAAFQMVGQHSCLAYRVSSNETRCDKPSPNISSHYADVPDFLASGAAYAGTSPPSAFMISSPEGGDLAIDMFVDDLESAFWLYRPDVVILQVCLSD